MTKRKMWPYAAQQQRDEAAINIQQAIKQLRHLQRLRAERVTRTELLLRLGIAMDQLHTAVRWLERAGAPVKLEE